MKVRSVIAYRHYFIDFMKSLPEKMQDKVVKTILDKIATERDLDELKAKEEKKKNLLKDTD